MFPRVRLLLAAAALAGLTGCGQGVPKDAVASAEKLLDAVAMRDRVAFEATVDRPAVREDLRGQLVEVARANGVEVDGGPSEFALDRMIVPEAFKLVDTNGMRVFEAPGADELADRMKTTGKGRVCLQGEDQACLLTFAKVKGDKAKGEKAQTWRLVGMQAQDLTLTVRGS